jgi:Protein of unknown function (DUF1573)
MSAILLLALTLVPREGGSLYCAQPVADRGELRGGPAISHSFAFSNRGSEQLEIIHVQPSCGCLAPRITATRLKPGEAARLDLTIGTVSQPEGDNLWSVRVFYRVAGEPKDQFAEWRVKARLVREVGVEPAASSLRGKPGLTTTIAITDLREKPLQLVGAFPSSNHLTAEVGDWQRGDKGWNCKVSVRISDSCPAGKFDEAIQIISRDADYREIRVPVSVIRK